MQPGPLSHVEGAGTARQHRRDRTPADRRARPGLHQDSNERPAGLRVQLCGDARGSLILAVSWSSERRAMGRD